MAQNEIEGSFEVGTPVWSPISAKASLRLQRTWASRGAEYLETVAESAGMTPAEIEVTAESDERRIDLLVTVGTRVQQVSDPDYRDALARLVGAAFEDEARIDESTMIAEELLALGPAHLRVLRYLDRMRTLPTSHRGRYRPESPDEIAKYFDLSLVAVIAILDRLVAAGFVRHTANVEITTERNEYDDPIYEDRARRIWTVTPWGTQALAACGQS
ncbi:MAG: hypothetical protein ACJ72L_11660 [Marmoricola sp.]